MGRLPALIGPVKVACGAANVVGQYCAKAVGFRGNAEKTDAREEIKVGAILEQLGHGRVEEDSSPAVATPGTRGKVIPGVAVLSRLDGRAGQADNGALINDVWEVSDPHWVPLPAPYVSRPLLTLETGHMVNVRDRVSQGAHPF